MEETTPTTETDGLTVRSPGSLGCRSPPSLSPAVSMATPPTTASPPPPPLVSAPSLHPAGISPPIGGHPSPPVFPSPPPTSRPPHFIPPFYFPHYASPPPPPIHTSDPSANDCKLLEYRNQKVAAFVINGETMLCLPQAFELFLKNLVGGLHTVYTKLKRLGIEPLVCNVEQVRVLRGLGAIQPGVNRCKLLCVKHFDILYKDCTTARPGRPPKRPHEILNYGLGGGVGVPGGMPPHGLTPEALMALKKTRMDGVGPPFLNGAPPNPHRDLLDKSPLLSNGYNPPPKAFMAQYMALNGGALPHPALLAHGGLPLPPHPGAPWTQPLQQPHGPPDLPFKSGPHPEAIARSLACRASYDEVLKQLDRFREDQSRSDRLLGLDREDHDGLGRDTPSKSNGYGDSDVLNLSSKSDSHEDLSEAGLGAGRGGGGGGRDPSEERDRDSGEGRPSSPSPLLRDAPSNSSAAAAAAAAAAAVKYHHNSIAANFNNNYNHHHSLLARHHHHHHHHHSQQQQHDDDEHNEKELSDNDDFDDKNDTSDHDDFEFNDRSFKSPMNNNNQNATNNNINSGIPTSNGGLLGSLVVGGGGSSSSSSSSSMLGRTPGPVDRLDERLHPVGLPLPGGLMGLGLGPAGEAAVASLAGGGGGPGAGAGGPPPLGGASCVVGLTGAPLSSLENLLGNIQNLLKVATESVRHEERQKEQLRSEFLRQKDLKERLEKQLMEDEKQKELFQRRLKKERRARRRLEEELTEKLKRLSQYEPGVKELLKNTEGMSQEAKNAAMVAAVAAAVVSASATSPTVSSGGNGPGGMGAGGGNPSTVGGNGSGNNCGVTGVLGGGNILLNGGGSGENNLSGVGNSISVSLSSGGGNCLGVGGGINGAAGGGITGGSSNNGGGGSGGGIGLSGSNGGGNGLHLSSSGASSPPKKDSHRLSPKSPPDMDLVRPPVVTSTDAAASLFFSKSMLFNCTA